MLLHAVVHVQAGKERGVERGHGDRPYENFEKVEFDCEGQVRVDSMQAQA